MPDPDRDAGPGRGVRPSARSPHVVIVGGGITGLAAAHRIGQAAPAVRITVLESAPVIGGKLAQAEVAGVPVDTGAESLLNRRPEAVDLVRAVGLGDDLCHPATTSASVWSRGSLRPMPPTVLGVPSDVVALARSGVVSRSGVARALLDRVLPGRELGEHADTAVGTFVRRRLGREISGRLLEPLLGGVYAGHADRLSLRAAAPQIAELAAGGGSLLAAAAAKAAARREQPDVPVFAGIVGGVGRLPAAVATAAHAGVRTSTTVRELRRTETGWQLVVGRADAGEVVAADAVLVATPAAPTARLLEGVAPAAATALRAVETASVAVVTLAVPVSGLPASPPGSGFLVPPADGRAVKAVTWSSRKWAWVTSRLGGDTLLLRASFGRHGEVETLQRTDTELVQLAADELGDAAGLHGPLADALVTRWGGGLPQYAVGHRDRVARIRHAVAAVDGLEVAGASYDGLGVAACIADGQRAADRLVGALRRHETMGA